MLALIMRSRCGSSKQITTLILISVLFRNGYVTCFPQSMSCLSNGQNRSFLSSLGCTTEDSIYLPAVGKGDLSSRRIPALPWRVALSRRDSLLLHRQQGKTGSSVWWDGVVRKWVASHHSCQIILMRNTRNRFCSHSRRENYNRYWFIGCVHHRGYPLNKMPDALILLSMSYFLDGYIAIFHLCRNPTTPHLPMSPPGMPKCSLTASLIQPRTQGGTPLHQTRCGE